MGEILLVKRKRILSNEEIKLIDNILTRVKYELNQPRVGYVTVSGEKDISHHIPYYIAYTTYNE